MLGRSTNAITVMLVGSGLTSEKSFQKMTVPLGVKSEILRAVKNNNEESRIVETRFVSSSAKTSTAEKQSSEITGEGVAEKYSENRKSGGETGSQLGILNTRSEGDNSGRPAESTYLSADSS